MRSQIPFDIIFNVIEELAVPSNPFAYGFEDDVRDALQACSLVCKALHRFTSTILYRSIRIHSVQRLRRVCQLPRQVLEQQVQSLCIYIDLDDVEAEEGSSVGFKRLRMGKRKVAEKAARRIRELADHVCALIMAPGTNLTRLALRLTPSRKEWNDAEAQTAMQGASRDALARVEAVLMTIIPNLTELVIPDDTMGARALSSVSLVRLRRLAVYGSVFPMHASSSLSLDYLCLICLRPNDMASVVDQSELNHSARKVIALCRTASGFSCGWCGNPQPVREFVQRLRGPTEKQCTTCTAAGTENILEWAWSGALWTPTLHNIMIEGGAMRRMGRRLSANLDDLFRPVGTARQ